MNGFARGDGGLIWPVLFLFFSSISSAFADPSASSDIIELPTLGPKFFGASKVDLLKFESSLVLDNCVGIVPKWPTSSKGCPEEGGACYRVSAIKDVNNVSLACGYGDNGALPIFMTDSEFSEWAKKAEKPRPGAKIEYPERKNQTAPFWLLEKVTRKDNAFFSVYITRANSKSDKWGCQYGCSLMKKDGAEISDSEKSELSALVNALAFKMKVVSEVGRGSKKQRKNLKSQKAPGEK